MISNGLLLTSRTPGIHTASDSRYRGVAFGTPWPLAPALPPEKSDWTSGDADLVAAVEDITLRRAFGDGTYPPAVLTDVPLLRRYAGRCADYGIGSRLLLCETPRPWPVLPPEVARTWVQDARFLGHDYAYSDASFSAVDSDLYAPPSPELAALAARRNAAGLFETEDDLNAFVDARWRFVREAGETYVERDGMRVRQTPLEDSGDFVAFRVSELDLIRLDAT